MNNPSWFDMAPWIAIAVTLILSVVIPLLTQIANNRFQLKLKQLEVKNKLSENKLSAFSEFAQNVGACIACADAERMQQAGSSIQKMVLFLPEENWGALEQLYYFVRKCEWDKAETVMNGLSKVASRIMNEKQ